jgi:hypothetical protein
MSDITVRPLSTSQHPRGMADGNNYYMIPDLILVKNGTSVERFSIRYQRT